MEDKSKLNVHSNTSNKFSELSKRHTGLLMFFGCFQMHNLWSAACVCVQVHTWLNLTFKHATGCMHAYKQTHAHTVVMSAVEFGHNRGNSLTTLTQEATIFLLYVTKSREILCPSCDLVG